jgi:hypothetical protein
VIASITGAGRPLRFLAVTLGGWTVVRVAMLWPTIDSVPSLVNALAPPVAAATRALGAAPMVPAADPPAGTRRIAVAEHARTTSIAKEATKPPVAPPHEPQPAAATVAPSSTPRQPPPLRPAPLASPPRRLAGSAWLIARGGRSNALIGGQLGASQAGARVTYALLPGLALAGRVSAPLKGRGAEAAIGVDWQPTSAPIHVIAEQRLSLDGGRGGPTLFVVGGLDPTPVALGFSIDAYGQAGGIRRSGHVIGFADGAARIARPVARIGAARVELGAGAWGGIQPGAARLDVGPSAALIVPIGGRATRFSLDWRQRVAGRARPGSGPALSIGSDF